MKSMHGEKFFEALIHWLHICKDEHGHTAMRENLDKLLNLITF